VLFAVDLHEDLVRVPSHLAGFHAGNLAFSDLGREDQAKLVPPETDSCMARIDAALMQ
jgi:hypothetical protein